MSRVRVIEAEAGRLVRTSLALLEGAPAGTIVVAPSSVAARVVVRGATLAAGGARAGLQASTLHDLARTLASPVLPTRPLPSLAARLLDEWLLASGVAADALDEARAAHLATHGFHDAGRALAAALEAPLPAGWRRVLLHGIARLDDAQRRLVERLAERIDVDHVVPATAGGQPLAVDRRGTDRYFDPSDPVAAATGIARGIARSGAARLSDVAVAWPGEEQAHAFGTALEASGLPMVDYLRRRVAGAPGWDEAAARIAGALSALGVDPHDGWGMFAETAMRETMPVLDRWQPASRFVVGMAARELAQYEGLGIPLEAGRAARAWVGLIGRQPWPAARRRRVGEGVLVVRTPDMEFLDPPVRWLPGEPVAADDGDAGAVPSFDRRDREYAITPSALHGRWSPIPGLPVLAHGIEIGNTVHRALDWIASGRWDSAMAGRAAHRAAVTERLAGHDLGLAEDCVRRTVASDLFRRALSSEERWSELSLAWQARAGALDAGARALLAQRAVEAGRTAPADDDPLWIEGIADLVFSTRGGLVVVDYKTDPWIETGHLVPLVERYRAQVGLYAAALVATTGRPVIEQWLLFSAGPDRAEAVRLDDSPGRSTCD